MENNSEKISRLEDQSPDDNPEGRPPQNTKLTELAGTGFMLSPLEAMARLEQLGYNQSAKLSFDHIEMNNGEERLYPDDFDVDKILRFEYSSDPDDQSILYAISSRKSDAKGIFMESYGLYHEEMSPALLRKLMERTDAA